MLVPKFSPLRLAASLTFVIAALCFTPAVLGATFTVTNTLNSGAGSLRQAVLDSNAAAGSDTIVFDAGVFSSPQTIVLASSLSLDPAVGDWLSITGPGANLLTISGNSAVRIFNVGSGDTVSVSGVKLTLAVSGAILNNGTLTLTNVNFTSNTNSSGGAISNASTLIVTGCVFDDNVSNGGGATGNGGGAIYNSIASPQFVTITDSTFTNNRVVTASALSGGAIRNRFGTMTISNSTFSNNSSVNTAGAISNGETLTIAGSTFTGNTATDDAGAVYSTGTLSISNSQFNGNSAEGYGGGLYVSGTLTISNTTVSGNTANSNNDTVGNGGGLYLNSATATISGSTISGNSVPGNATTAGNGGGIDSSGPLNVTNSTISGNTAGRIGGGIRATGVSTAIANIESSTIVDNTAGLTGGGIVRFSSSNPVNLHNSIFANNSDNGTAPNIQGTVVSQDYNLIEVATGATITGTTANNIIGQDPNLGPLANNLGPTFTHAVLAGSPAKDAADPATFPATDQRGAPRPQDGRAEIGAYEVYSPTAAPVTVVGRVFANMRPLRGAYVVMSGPGGSVRAVTNTFGYFRFDNVEAGESYVINVTAKQYRFESRVINADSDVMDLVFNGQPLRSTKSVASAPVETSIAPQAYPARPQLIEPMISVKPRKLRRKSNID